MLHWPPPRPASWRLLGCQKRYRTFASPADRGHLHLPCVLPSPSKFTSHSSAEDSHPPPPTLSICFGLRSWIGPTLCRLCLPLDVVMLVLWPAESVG